MMPRSVAAGALALASVLTGCGSWGRVGTQPAPQTGETLTQILDLNSVYRRLGRLTAGAPLPFVADLAFFAGPGDSTLAVFALSLENRNLSFQREGDAFVARYRVELSARPGDGGPPVVLVKEQIVRVASFAETQRNEESILFQEGLTLRPGPWHLGLQLTDLANNRSTTAARDYTVPAFGPGTLTAPYLTYQVKGRGSRSAPIAIILNPRGTLSYGSDSATAYVEGYAMPGPHTVPIRLVDSRDSVVLLDSLHFAGGREVESELLRFRPDSAPLGELRVIVGSGADTQSTAALVSFSQNWVITNFDDMLSLLRYYPDSPQLDSLRKAAPADRERLWRAFWKASDPNAATPANEGLDQYFLRIAVANQRFRDEGIAGWRTDRGEVLIRLGEPDEVYDASPVSEGRLIRWGYTSYQLVLYFVDETGFGRFRLTPSSRADMERVAARLSRQND